jgi:transposase
MDCFHWIVQVVLLPEHSKNFPMLPKRWVVERTFGWLTEILDFRFWILDCEEI